MGIKVTFTNGAVRQYDFVSDVRIENGLLLFTARDENNVAVVVANVLSSVQSYETGIF